MVNNMKRLLFLFCLISVAVIPMARKRKVEVMPATKAEDYTPYYIEIKKVKASSKKPIMNALRLKLSGVLIDKQGSFDKGTVTTCANASKKEILTNIQDQPWADKVALIPIQILSPDSDHPEFLDQNPNTMSERMREYVQDYKATYGE